MNFEPQNSGPSAADLARWIQISGESDFVDAKGPVMWDGADASASLAKDIASFANSRDGGVLVIGKSEASDGSFLYEGLTPDQAASFDTTKVGQWVNSRFAPPIRLACYQLERDDKKFIVIIVQEFDDLPSLCIKSFQETTNPKNHLLREGTIYVRNQNAESKPIKTVDELRVVIGLATRKRGDELMSHLQAMLQGHSFAALEPRDDPYAQEIEKVKADLDVDLNVGGWWLTCHPQQFIGKRWESKDDLEQLVSRNSVRLFEEFPGHTRGTVSMGWGIANEFYGEKWALTKSGLFCFWQEYRENQIEGKPTGYVDDNAPKAFPAGTWLECGWSIRLVVNFFMFANRLASEYKVGEEVCIDLHGTNLSGRHLASLNFHDTLGFTPVPCRASEYNFTTVVPMEGFRANWEATCAKALSELFELFPGHFLDHAAIRRGINRFKTRGY